MARRSRVRLAILSLAFFGAVATVGAAQDARLQAPSLSKPERVATAWSVRPVPNNC